VEEGEVKGMEMEVVASPPPALLKGCSSDVDKAIVVVRCSCREAALHMWRL